MPAATRTATPVTALPETTRRVPVTLGVQGEDVVQVTGGLDAGQRIAISGADEIRPGDKPS